MKNLEPATMDEAITGFSATEGDSDHTALLGGPASTELWTNTAFISMCKRTGAARKIRVSHADAALYVDGSIVVNHASGYPNPNPRATLRAYFEIENAGRYVCVVRLARIDDIIAKTRFTVGGNTTELLVADEPTSYSFAANFNSDTHNFEIEHLGSTFTFFSVTVLQRPELSPG